MLSPTIGCLNEVHVVLKTISFEKSSTNNFCVENKHLTTNLVVMFNIFCNCLSICFIVILLCN